MEAMNNKQNGRTTITRTTITHNNNDYNNNDDYNNNNTTTTRLQQQQRLQQQLQQQQLQPQQFMQGNLHPSALRHQKRLNNTRNFNLPNIPYAIAEPVQQAQLATAVTDNFDRKNKYEQNSRCRVIFTT